MKGNYSNLFIVFLLFVVFTLGLSLFRQNQTYKEENSKLEQTIKKQKKEEKKAKIEVSDLTKKVETLFIEKNGTAKEALEMASNQLFAAVYNYDSERPEDSVSERKKKASNYATNNALHALFPQDATQGTSSVSTVSSLENNPEVYLMTSNDQEFKALVLIRYSLSIAGSEEQQGTFLYKVEFDSLKNQFTTIKNLGEITNL
jgi:cell division protein FtsB